MFDDDPRRDACIIAARLPDRTIRRLFGDLLHHRDDRAAERLRRALGPGADALDLTDPVLREWLLEALEYRISPPDDEDPGPCFDGCPQAHQRAAVDDESTGPWTRVIALGPAF